MIAAWMEKHRNGDVSINEIKEDCFLTSLVFNTELKEYALMAGPIVKLKPSIEDIEYFFDSSDMVLDVLRKESILS